jgi:dipeptidase D
MSQEVEGLVETSTNLAVCRVESKRAYFQESSRSSLQQAIQILQASLFAMGRLAGGTCIDKGSYPGWQPNMDSALLKRARAVYEKTQGKPAQVKAVHAGLECGIIGEKLGGDMEMISFGPQIEFPHSPREQVHILSVEKFYAFLSALVEDLAYSKEL